MILRILKKIFRVIRSEYQLKKQESKFRHNKKLKELYSVFLASPHMDRSVSPASSLALSKAIKKNKPKNILELGTGTGCATAVIASFSDSDAKITTIEDKKFYIDIAKELIPEKLRHKVSFIEAEYKTFLPGGVKYQVFSGYKGIPKSDYDFILVDGPDKWENNNQPVKLPNGDLFKIIDDIKQGALIYIDARKDTVKFYTSLLKSKLKLVEQDHHYALLKKI